MQNFSPLALKLREKIRDDKLTYCKNATFQTAPYIIKFLLIILAKPPLALCVCSINQGLNDAWRCQGSNDDPQIPSLMP